MPGILLENLELQSLLNIKEEGYNYRQRREEDWRENYELYRDKVTINRLTQRQSVNLPLMKTTLRTLLKDIDDMPVIEFENLDNDKQAEVFQNEYWKWTLELNNAEIQDIVDKKQNFFYGRSFDSWQIEDGKIIFDIEDTEDILVPRFLNPYDIDSARSLVHLHIFPPLTSLKNNPNYDQDEVAKLEEFFKSQLGIIKAKDNESSLQQKNKKLAEMGVSDTEDPVLGETYVELTMYYVFKDKGEEWIDNRDRSKNTTDDEQIFHYVEAENQCILQKKPQEKIIGTTSDHYWRNHYRYNTWGDDIDKQDFWTDGIADIVRVPNKVLNSWFSQLVENRTLRNFGMHYYDSSLKAEGFIPGTFNPVPWGWYPVPGRPQDVLQKVDIPDLSESLDEMNFVTEMTEKATGATSTQQGVVQTSQKTLGEVQLAQAEAKARTQGMSKFYTHAWKDRATKFLKLIEAASDKLDAMKIYKEGKNSSNIFQREISPKDWMTKAGYRVKVWSQDEKKANDADKLKKLQTLRLEMFDNPKVLEIYQRKLAEYSDLTPDEIGEIMQFEEQKRLAMANNPPIAMQPGQPNINGQPMPPQSPMEMTGQVPPIAA
jgi:hypothetical protein